MAIVIEVGNLGAHLSVERVCGLAAAQGSIFLALVVGLAVLADWEREMRVRNRRTVSALVKDWPVFRALRAGVSCGHDSPPVKVLSLASAAADYALCISGMASA